MYFVASGINVVIGQPLPVEGSEYVVELLTKLFEKHFGANWTFQPDPVEAAHHMIDIIDRKRTALGLPPPLYEAPYAPKKIESTAAGESSAAEPAQLHDKTGIIQSRACS